MAALTKEEFEAWAEETANAMNEELAKMTPEEREEVFKSLENLAARIGGFPDSKPTP